MKRKALFLFFIISFGFAGRLSAQEYPLLINKTGSFEIIDWGVYTHYDCGFTKTETNAHFVNLKKLIDAVRYGNPVLNELKGFDGRARIYAEPCGTRFHYGIPAMINFEFCTFYKVKDKEVKAGIEPPSWKLFINQLCVFTGCKYPYAVNKPQGQVRPGFDFEKWKKAGEKFNELFFTPGKKETIMPGVDVYNNGDVIIYNPDRPPYWIPVTVREVYELISEYYKLSPELEEYNMISKMIEQEWAMFTPEEKESSAYLGGRLGILKVGPEKNDVQMMKPNPAYWNKNISRSEIQIISFQLPANKKYLQKQTEEALRNNSISYHEYRFEETLAVSTFTSFIKK